MTAATVKLDKSYGSVWATGDLVAGYEKPQWPADARDVYSVVLCVEARELNSKGGVRNPARMATITGPSWASVCREVQALGFTRPTLKAAEVRNPRPIK